MNTKKITILMVLAIVFFTLAFVGLAFISYKLITTQGKYQADTASLHKKVKTLQTKNADLNVSYNVVLSRYEDCTRKAEVRTKSPKQLIKDIEQWDKANSYYPKSIEDKFNNRTQYAIKDNGEIKVRRIVGFVPTKTEFSSGSSIGNISQKSKSNPVSKFGDFDIK